MPFGSDKFSQRSSFNSSHFGWFSKIHLQLFSKYYLRFLWFLFLCYHSDVFLVFGKRCNFFCLFFILIGLDDLTDNILGWICFVVALFLLVLLFLLLLEGLFEVLGGILELAIDPLGQTGLDLADLSGLRHELGLVDISGKTHILSDDPFFFLHLYKSYYIQITSKY